MDKTYLRHLLVKNKDFLKKLYEQQNCSKTIYLASDEALNVLVKVLHLISLGEIELINEKDKNDILQSKKKTYFLSLQNRQKLHSVLKSPRAEKIKFLRHFSKMYHILLKGLFES